MLAQRCILRLCLAAGETQDVLCCVAGKLRCHISHVSVNGSQGKLRHWGG